MLELKDLDPQEGGAQSNERSMPVHAEVAANLHEQIDEETLVEKTLVEQKHLFLEAVPTKFPLRAPTHRDNARKNTSKSNHVS